MTDYSPSRIGVRPFISPAFLTLDRVGQDEPESLVVTSFGLFGNEAVRTDLNGDGRKEVLAAQFFTKTLAVCWQEGDRWKGRAIDDQLGSPFDLELADINNNGHRELLVTNHESDDSAGVFAYEIPVDFKTGLWERHTLYQGFKTRIELDQDQLEAKPFQASPGSATAFYPNLADQDTKPYILVSGDGTQQAHLLKPVNQDCDDWRFEESTLVDTRGTVGQCAVGDVDGDGFCEVFVPAFDRDLIYAYTFAPETALVKGAASSTRIKGCETHTDNRTR